MMLKDETARGRGIVSFAASVLSQHPHLIKYVVIGGAASAIDVGLFLFIYNVLETSIFVAHSISVPVSVLFSFSVNARHNFRTDDYLLARLASFVTVCAIGYGVGYAITAGIAAMTFDGNIGKVVSLPFVFALQYLLNSQVTFRKVRH